MRKRHENAPATQPTPPRHRADVNPTARTRRPRRSLVLGGGLVALALAMPTALAVTGQLQAPQPAAGAAGDLVVNGGFENGTTGWKVNRRTRQGLAATTPAASGAAAGHLTTKQTGTVVVNDTAPTVAATTAGRSYVLTAKVRSTGRDLAGRLRIREVGSAGELAKGYADFRATTAGWAQVKLTYTSATTGAAMDLNVLGFDVPTGSGLLVDDISLVPATAGSSSAPTGSPSASASTKPSPSPSTSPSRGPSTSPSATPSSSPTSSPSTTPPVAAPGACVSNPMGIPARGATLLGAAVSGSTDTETREAQLGRNLALHRTFYQSDGIDRAVRNATADLAAGRLPWISFKAPLSWADMAAGKGDAWSTELADALATVPGPVWVAVHHEPENDGDMDLWTEMQRQIAPIIHARTNNVAYSIIYSGWNTFGGGNNTVATKWPGDANVDILAIDAYNDFGAVRDGKEGVKVLDLKTYYAKMATWAEAHGTAWAIGETGQTSKASAVDPTWLDRTYHDMVAMGGAGLSYYDSTANSVADWTLDDPVKFARFRALLAESARLC